jgi:hypothetical protein
MRGGGEVFVRMKLPKTALVGDHLSAPKNASAHHELRAP